MPGPKKCNEGLAHSRQDTIKQLDMNVNIIQNWYRIISFNKQHVAVIIIIVVGQYAWLDREIKKIQSWLHHSDVILPTLHWANMWSFLMMTLVLTTEFVTIWAAVLLIHRSLFLTWLALFFNRCFLWVFCWEWVVFVQNIFHNATVLGDRTYIDCWAVLCWGGF